MKIEDIIDALIDDLSDRRGLRQEWEQIDSDVQEEIKTTWANIIKEGISKP